ncbi:transcriptional regulator [Actinosynnema sp. ALI-1.44]|uniref:helix-turn-helix domain-containing protein n=1 Tax=Actinosynnema sp. ALI-1.44 TaxID=1933779 RepID=UPI00097C7B73|nr:helix-turn-helix transcriptional regulator [Actinosynnema sp. ALI-1.44]ONI77188.1 transcriptional regulator [Actinosynnema sp. ALI-1.44]
MSQDNTDVASATVRRWQLTEALRRMREEAGLTIDKAVEQLLAARAGKWSSAKLSRIENREQGVQSRDVVVLLDLYRVTDPDTRAWLVDLALNAHERGYWRAIRKDHPDDFHGFLSVEAALVALRQFETMLVPGLLQTIDFARAVIKGINPELTPDVVERRAMARMTRQQVITRANPLRYHVVLEESILERQIGSPTVMRNQLRRLIDEAGTDHITVQVLPKSTGAGPALEGPFSILTLPDPVPDFGYAEGPGGGAYMEDPEKVRERTISWGAITERALPEADSVRLIEEAANSYT